MTDLVGLAPASEAGCVTELADQLRQLVTRPWTVMEVCGGQTHAIVRWGLDQLLPEGLRLIHGPGCPVCVTAAATIDAAQTLARQPEVILCSYGDMLRVPGSARSARAADSGLGPPGADPLVGEDLLGVRASGGDVRLLTSPLQALDLARRHPDRQVVFFAVGFETTAPATALLVQQARALAVPNLSLLMAHVRVPPAMEAILSARGNQVQGFLAAGHVCAVMGISELEVLVARHQVPVVVTGFEPLDLMRGLVDLVRLLEAEARLTAPDPSGGRLLSNSYDRVVRADGNPAARKLVQEVFCVVDRPWRGFGVIPGGGLDLAVDYQHFDARRRFGIDLQVAEEQEPCGSAIGSQAETGPCISGLILQGRRSPDQCPVFGTGCTPDHPLGAPMVSSEGACAAYHRYRPRG